MRSPTLLDADLNRTEWQWEQLRRMKTGGNESATKYFQSHGGAAALASKDPKQKYTSNAANKYKDELARRVEADQKKYVERGLLCFNGYMADNPQGIPTVWS